MRKNIVLTAVGAVLTGLIAVVAWGYQRIAGGPVGTNEEFRAHVRRTTWTGDAVYLALTPGPRGAPYPVQEGSSSCVDDFGFDEGDVTRDRPIYTWDLSYERDEDFRAALKALGAAWRAEGREVEKTGTGITATLDDGIRVTVQRNWYTDDPELRAEGRCTRYRDTYDDSYDYMYDKNGDGTLDEDERPGY
nr:hypothetical protein SBE_001710 [Streptomyces sp. SBE_14.2]